MGVFLYKQIAFPLVSYSKFTFRFAGKNRFFRYLYLF
jgi:hypothetical protein